MGFGGGGGGGSLEDVVNINRPANMTAAPGVENDLLQNYIQGGHVSSTDLVGAQLNGKTGRVFSPRGADITDVYAKYMTWQQTQRVNRNKTSSLLDEAAAAPGRNQTILVDPTSKKNSVLGDIPKSVLG